ncbi:hypothetical protein [Pelagibacterium sp.]|uniref:hypothetical protein n=1 Tax=Pelagibacterium sp. TaxID=1967288 RepID=UPI003C7AA455
MQNPIAITLTSSGKVETYRVSVAPENTQKLKRSEGRTSAPAVLLLRRAIILQDVSAGIIDPADVISAVDGDWSNAIVVICDERAAIRPSTTGNSSATGDEAFLEHVKRSAPELLRLARKTLLAVRAAEVDGDLVETNKGRWVNRPLNTFTLKLQPKAGNLQFTLYGNPNDYTAEGFLLADQNSYSRGWIRNESDVGRFAALAQQAQTRRKTK